MMELNLEQILEYQRNRPPYLMIDHASEVIPGESAKGYKELKDETWFFECHFPGDPSMPGMLQIEAMVQLCALAIFVMPGNKGKVAYITNVKNIKFARKIVPGDTLELDTKIESFRRGVAKASGVGTVNGELACKAEFTFALPHILEEFKLK